VLDDKVAVEAGLCEGVKIPRTSRLRTASVTGL
jgi:hypothetical protein